MPKYQSNSESTIQAVFRLEGDALDRAGFREPDTTHAPEDYVSMMARLATKTEEPEVIYE